MAKNPLRPVGWILTHVIAASVGGAVWFALRSEPSSTGKSAAAAAEKTSFRREARRERTDRSVDGERVLSELTGQTSQRHNNQPRRFNYSEYIKESSSRVIKKADELAPAADVAAAAMEAMAFAVERQKGGTITAEMSKEWENVPARVLHWMRKDPEAALAHMSTLKMTGIYNDAVMAAVVEHGPVAASKWIAGNEGNNNLQYVVAAEAGRLADPTILAELKQAISPDQWKRVDGMISSAWPPEKREEMFAFAMSENKANALNGFLGQQGVEGYQWLKGKLASDEIDPAFKAAILKDPGYRSMIWSNAEIPFEERMEILSGFNKDKTAEQLALEIGARDVNGFFGQGRDWRYAFHSGAATMDEIYEAAAAGLPDLARSSPEALRNQLFKELAHHNPDAIFQEFEAYPPEQKWDMALKPARWMFQHANPEVFYDYVKRIPVEASETSFQTRLGAWNDSAETAYRKLGKGYTDWVLALPDDMDREMACYNLLKYVPKESELAQNLRSSVKDARLIEKLTPKP